MAYTYTDGAYSAQWTPSGSSSIKKVGARLWYQVTQTPTTYRVDVYGQETLYHDNMTVTIGGRLNLSGTGETTGSKTYTYSKSGTNHTGVYYTICGTKSYTWYKQKYYQYGSASMKAYRNNYEASHYSLASVSFTIPPIDNYAVSYNANGGTGSISAQTKWYNEGLTLSNGSGFTKENYKIIGWATSAAKANAGTVDYALGGVYTNNSAVTLYAVWELNAVPIKTKISSVWKNGIIYIKSNGSWKLPFKGFVKEDGTWKQIKV